MNANFTALVKECRLIDFWLLPDTVRCSFLASCPVSVRNALLRMNTAI
ncbi:hypothetical protein [Marinomonas fungiae]|nr:hypothetical protein [Marinomonas fungiae]